MDPVPNGFSCSAVVGSRIWQKLHSVNRKKSLFSNLAVDESPPCPGIHGLSMSLVKSLASISAGISHCLPETAQCL